MLELNLRLLLLRALTLEITAQLALQGLGRPHLCSTFEF